MRPVLVKAGIVRADPRFRSYGSLAGYCTLLVDGGTWHCDRGGDTRAEVMATLNAVLGSKFGVVLNDDLTALI